ncbi:hypothetical protein B0H12DRAFT_578947 [Mycena haematopus]|nr:hypothetical protein B0H12DRAFT_578947 [Mycena haematopus]
MPRRPAVLAILLPRWRSTHDNRHLFSPRRQQHLTLLHHPEGLRREGQGAAQGDAFARSAPRHAVGTDTKLSKTPAAGADALRLAEHLLSFFRTGVGLVIESVASRGVLLSSSRLSTLFDAPPYSFDTTPLYPDQKIPSIFSPNRPKPSSSHLLARISTETQNLAIVNSPHLHKPSF